MTWNVHGLRAGIPAVGRVIRSVEPDVVLLQESGPRIALLRLGAALGMQVADDPIAFPRRRVKNAVLARFPWVLGERWFHRFAESARFYPRGAMIAVVSDGVRGLVACSVHLGLRPAERIRHERELRRRLGEAARGRPAVIGGDFNELPDGRAIASLSRLYADAWATSGVGRGETFPSKAPAARIDYVFLGPDLATRETRVPFDAGVVRGSDHLPVVTEIELPS
jgi:endonuclease/exonuclease/phosphatase family metal-dependent hydrolase